MGYLIRRHRQIKGIEFVLEALWRSEHMFDTERLPVGLESLVPGPELVAALAGVDRDRLDGHDRATLLELRSRLRSWIDAEFYADIQSVSEAVGELYGPSEVEEVFETTSSEGLPSP